MITQTPRDPWRVAWQVVTSNVLLAILLLATAAGLLMAAWLSQAPAADPATYARWLSETQAHFGKATQTMQALGVFAIDGTRAPAAFHRPQGVGGVIPSAGL
jgi:hypothetical protein